MLRNASIALAVLVGSLSFSGCGEESPRHDVTDDVRQCTQRLRAIYKGLVVFETKYEQAPPLPGVAFFGELIPGGAWTPDKASELTCPGPNAQPQREGTDFTLSSNLTAEDSAYAGRDVEAHPLDCFPCGGGHVLMACDNANGMNHDGVMNVLYADGSVATLNLAKLIEQGKLPEGTTTIPVGPDSPIEALRVLKQD